MNIFGYSLWFLLFLNVNAREDQEKCRKSSPVFKDSDVSVLPWNILLNSFFGSSTSENAVEPPLKIGAFNIQTLTDRKFQRRNVISIVEKVIRRYDLILITELMVSDFEHVSRLITVLNRLVQLEGHEEGRYKVSISESHPETRESCAFFYRADKLTVHKAESYENRNGKFFRKPLIVHFKTKTLRDMDDFIALGLHVKPNKAVREMNELANVYDYIKDKYRIEDVLMMGDFNADCTYVKGSQWENISLWTRPEFIWPIKHNMDTTISHGSCALDRFVFAGRKLEKGVIMSSAGVFNLQEAYGLTFIEMQQISDHFPIELQIRGKASVTAEKHLNTKICVTVEDSRTLNISAEGEYFSKQATSAGFEVIRIADGFSVLKAEASEKKEALELLKNLSTSLPEVITSEQIQSLTYKVDHNSLKDDSSHADVVKELFTIIMILHNKKCTIFVCRETTLN